MFRTDAGSKGYPLFHADPRPEFAVSHVCAGRGGAGGGGSAAHCRCFPVFSKNFSLLVSGLPGPSSGRTLKLHDIQSFGSGFWLPIRITKEMSKCKVPGLSQISSIRIPRLGPQSLGFHKLPGDSYETFCLFVNFSDFGVRILYEIH